MEKIEIVAISPTGSGRFGGILYTSSGVIEYEADAEGTEISHISAEVNSGWKVIKKEKVIPAPVIEAKKEEVKEVKAEVHTPKVIVSESRSGKNKNKPSKR